MKSFAAFRRLVFASALSLPSLVLAHPGHEGGHGDGLTWDFAGDVVHFLTSPYHLLPVGAGAVIGVLLFRHFHAKRKSMNAARRRES